VSVTWTITTREGAMIFRTVESQHVVIGDGGAALLPQQRLGQAGRGSISLGEEQSPDIVIKGENH
jgi:hypothetical protein